MRASDLGTIIDLEVVPRVGGRRGYRRLYIDETTTCNSVYMNHNITYDSFPKGP